MIRRGHREIGRNVDLVGQFARKADAGDAAGDVILQDRFDHTHEGQGFVGDDGRVDEALLEHLSRLWAGNGEARPLFGHRGKVHPEFRPSRLQEFFQPRHGLRRVCRRGGHEEIVLAQSPGGAVVHHDTVVAQHDAVPRLADRKLGEGVGVDAVEQLGSIRPLHRDLAEGRHVAQPDTTAHGFRFPDIGFVQTFAITGKVPRPLPQAGLHHGRTLFEVPVVKWRAAQGLEVSARAAAPECTDTDRGVGRPESRGADLSDIPSERLGHDRKPYNVSHLALVRGHTEGGVPFQMLDGHIAFPVGQSNVPGGYVVLKIDERLQLVTGHAYFVQRLYLL